MSIKAAAKSDFMTVKKITHTTIREVYPHYYPEGAVLFFLRHHSDESILDDITEGSVFLCVNQDHIPVGTVTLKENEICRLFVLPQFQGMGYGKELLDFAEAEIAQNYTEIMLDASFPGHPSERHISGADRRSRYTHRPHGARLRECGRFPSSSKARFCST